LVEEQRSSEGKLKSKGGIVMVDEEPKRTEMIGKLFRKGERAADKARKAMANGIIEAFKAVSVALGMRDNPMTRSRKNALISIPRIRVTNGTLAIKRWEGVP
jgi:hypothetical protein